MSYSALVIHNRYQQSGGEDGVFESETALLESKGHKVLRYEVHNDNVTQLHPLMLAKNTIWNSDARRAIQSLIQRERPDIVHVHNTLPLLSPAIYYAARTERVPVVQTLHNYRLVCPNGLLLRDGKVCEKCVPQAVPISAVVHACYRGSRAATGAVTAMLTTHRLLGTWRSAVDTFIALTDFARHKMEEGGLPAEKIVIKPNFVDPDPGLGTHEGGYALFVGRLAPEKGLNVLLESWRDIGTELRIVGDGGDSAVHAQSIGRDEVVWLGRRPKQEVLSLMKSASFLVFPSIWFEGFPLTIVEAFAAGLPVIASKLGSAAEIVADGETGLHFRPGDAADLAAKVRWALAHPAEMRAMGLRARAQYEEKYTATRNYQLLMQIYRSALLSIGATHHS